MGIYQVEAEVIPELVTMLINKNPAFSQQHVARLRFRCLEKDGSFFFEKRSNIVIGYLGFLATLDGHHLP